MDWLITPIGTEGDGCIPMPGYRTPETSASPLLGSDTLGAMKLHVGCAMWTYAPWQGRYLPHPLSPRDRLRAYATWCNAVEGNTTFYATPALDTVKSWAEQTTPDFRFILKLPKPITHEHRLADVDDPLRAFLAAIEPLGQRAHALWIQLPPSFSPADLGALTSFLSRLPHEYRSCVEVRHRAFFEDQRSGQQLEKGLGDVGAEWVTFDTTVLFESPPVSDAEREAWTKKPRLPRRSLRPPWSSPSSRPAFSPGPASSQSPVMKLEVAWNASVSDSSHTEPISLSPGGPRPARDDRRPAASSVSGCTRIPSRTCTVLHRAAGRDRLQS